MHQLPIEQELFLAAEIGTLVALCIRLWWSGLYKTYPYFFGYLVLELLQTLLPVFVSVNSRMYRDWYVVSQALLICFSALVVLELYSTVLRGWAGIGNVSRRYIKVTLALAVAVSLLPLILEKPPNTLTGYLFIFQRPIVSSLLIFILLITAFLLYYPIPVGRNVLIYLMGYAVFYITNATSIFVRNLGYYWARPISDVNMAVYEICLAFWLLALHRSGEGRRVVPGHHWSPQDEERLLARLEAINSSLLRAGRK